MSVTLTITPSPAGWLDAVLANFEVFLQDHASCEKKASGMALNVASHYPDRPVLLNAMADLAVEELSHYREVVRLLIARGGQPGADGKDPYIRQLNALVRRGAELFLLDRLLVAAVVERRGAERFALLRDVLADSTQPNLPAGAQHLARFYGSIAQSEQRHWQTFVSLATSECAVSDATVQSRLDQLAHLEAVIVRNLPCRAALH